MTNKGRDKTTYSEPYTLAFMYNRSGKALLLKGYLTEIKEYIRSMRFTAFVNIRYYLAGRSRGSWELYHKGTKVDGIFVRAPRLDHGYDNEETKWIHKWEVNNYRTGKSLYFKRLPKRWIPEFDDLINK